MKSEFLSERKICGTKVKGSNELVYKKSKNGGTSFEKIRQNF